MSLPSINKCQITGTLCFLFGVQLAKSEDGHTVKLLFPLTFALPIITVHPWYKKSKQYGIYFEEMSFIHLF
jgi:hypothetical protein